ncbi:MAG TPA: non-homologous end-joining DNA ligase [Longimicrobiaceae bacterium]|nr:non-homologous end-joining DNA ligase [Longimicrobiaceae bacterium]
MQKATNATEIAGVRITSPGRVLYAEQGITKRELAEYYAAASGWILPQLEGRLLTLIRCPRGRAKQCFVQRRAGAGTPGSVRRVEVEEQGERVPFLTVDSLEGLLALVQLGTLELHTWSARIDRLDRPDRMIFDLDPAPELAFASVVRGAIEIRERLSALGLASFVKTTGGKGLHVVVPLARRSGWEEVREFARALAEEMERAEPGLYVAEASKAQRAGKVYVDYLRNAYAASAVAAYSTRARPGAAVSTPLAWEELTAALDPRDFTVRTVPDRLERLPRDPWADYPDVRQALTKAVRAGVRGERMPG